MVSYHANALDQVFSALSDPTRRAMLVRLQRQTLSVTELAQPFAMSLPAILKHLRVLERAGLIESRKDGRVHRCTLRPGAMKGAAGWIDRYRRVWGSPYEFQGRHFSRRART